MRLVKRNGGDVLKKRKVLCHLTLIWD